MNPPTLVAEVGCNHMGDLETAQEMIRIASDWCGVDVVKFQKRNPRELLTSAQYDAPHPTPRHSYGATYGEHRERLEFTIDQHAQLKEWCEAARVTYSTSVWDLTSAHQVVELAPEFIKIPSACNLYFDMIGYLCEHFTGDIHLSLGMTTKREEEAIVAFFEERQRLGDVVLYSCTSGYPVPFEDVGLYEIDALARAYGGHVQAIGFSGHHLGIATDVAAMALGASWIERHFTLDRTWKGTDHAASLEPDGMRRLGRDLRNVAKALEHKQQDILDIEQPQRDKLKWMKPESRAS